MTCAVRPDGTHQSPHVVPLKTLLTEREKNRLLKRENLLLKKRERRIVVLLSQITAAYFLLADEKREMARQYGVASPEEILRRSFDATNNEFASIHGQMSQLFPTMKDQ